MNRRSEMARQLIFLDFEVFPRFWCVTLALPYEGRIIQIWDDRDGFASFFREHADDVYVGYNIMGASVAAAGGPQILTIA